jgi:2,4-dienoyl-CoA reductase-like NADH-dependent reductase (Old Yellow Enzyme family)
MLAGREIGGWPDAVVGPSPIAWDPNYALPHELSRQEVRDVTNAFAAAAKRAVRAGVDSVEIHAAHGYLLNSFLSGASNHRTDEYGGSFEGRTRIVFETIEAVRAVIPSAMPLFLRVSSTDWLDEKKYPTAWGVADTIRLAKLLYVRGVDLLDCSSGGNHPEQNIQPHNEYQIEIAGQVKKALREEEGEAGKLLIGAVGGVGDGKWANKIVADGMADVVLAARAFLRSSEFTLTCADELGVKVQWPLQYLRRGRRAVKSSL